MTIFALLIAAMIVAALALLLPAFRGRDAAAADREQLNVSIARERLAELEAAHQRGELNQDEFAQARSELEMNLAADLAAEQGGERRGGKALLLVLVGLVPALALGVYLQLGSPQFLDVAGPGGGRAMERLAAEGKPPGSVEEMVAGLEARLAEAPNDPDGWYMLGRSYMSMNQYADAARAFEKLQQLAGEHPTALVALADALSMTQDGQLAGRPIELVQRALAVDPQEPTALWLAGQAAMQAEDYRTAVEYWMQALPALSQQPDLAEQLRTQIAQAAVAAGMTPEDLAALRPGVDGAAQPAGPAAGAAVKVSVRIGPELLDAVQPDDTLFVFARAQAGPPMPLAVGRYTLATLPDEIVLDDSSAMSPQLRISGFEQVVVQARIAKGGQPVAQSGDLQSDAVPVAVGAADTVQLVIDQRVP